MAVRQLLLPAFALFSSDRLNRQRIKAATRSAAIGLCHHALGWLSRPYQHHAGSCVVFAPHPDDETLGCGGLIARKRNEGLPVHVVFITDGSASHPGHPRLSPAEVVVIRHHEALEALAILGVESPAIHFLNETDGALNHLTPERQAGLVSQLAALLTGIKPAEIFLPCCPDGSSEHDAAFGFVSAALRRAQVQPAIWQYPVWSWWNPLLLFERIIRNRCCCVQPAEDYQAIKTQALSRYRSQVEPALPWSEPVLLPELVRVCNSGQEFFFRFVPPPPGAGAAGDPVI